MAIRIDGGTVVGWSGEHHELIPNGCVLIEGETIAYVWFDSDVIGGCEIINSVAGEWKVPAPLPTLKCHD